MEKCDIIIPIYNAYDCLKSCIDSVITNTDLSENRLILIDDKSPDERVLPLLEKYAKCNDSIILLKNEENLGFVGTVNRGMKYSNNDVLLLNSDTEVTKNWLKKIKECAYSQPMVATVTPLSNNATLASVPYNFIPNELPDGYTLEQMSKLVEDSSYNSYPEIMTGHGFCLYIRREVLDTVGYFDEETFGKGYGEENDFCYRCLDYGYRHLLCDNTYIYHKESQSFSTTKEKLIEKASLILKNKYPVYINRLEQWCLSNPIKYIGQNIAFNISNKEKRKNILFLIHDFKDAENHLGGTTLHVYDIVRNIRDKVNIHILTPEDGCYKLYSYYKDYKVESFYPSIKNLNHLYFYNSNYKNMLDEIVKKYGITLAHIHHMIGHYFDAIDVFKSNNVYTIFTFHDFYSICPKINRLYENKTYCKNIESDRCSKCLKTMYNDELHIELWNKCFYELLKKCDYLISPSESCKKEILDVYKDLNIDVIEHGIDLYKKRSTLKIEENETLNIAFVGAIGIIKGSRFLKQMLEDKKLKNVRVHLFGIADFILPKNSKKFVNHGKYKREELQKLLKENNIKLICLLSEVPETYCYTLTECISAGIPILALDYGAIGERISKYNFGWLLPKKSNYDDIVSKIEFIRHDKKEYSKKIKAINSYEIKNTTSMAEEYLTIYNKNSKCIDIDIDYMKDKLKNNTNYTINVSYADYSWVFDTLKWKLISKIKIPKRIKNVIRRMKEQ